MDKHKEIETVEHKKLHTDWLETVHIGAQNAEKFSENFGYTSQNFKKCKTDV